MAGVFSSITLRRSDGTTFNQRVWDESGTGAGPFQPVNIIATSAGVEFDPASAALQTGGNASLSSIDSKMSTLHTDLATTLAAYVDGLEALITSSNTKLDTVHTDLATTLAAYVDGLEALIASSNTKLDTVHTDLATTISGYVDGLEVLNGPVNEAAPATDTASSGLNGRLQRVAQRLTALLGAGATTIAKAEDAASADADVGVPAMAVRKATPANTSGTDGDYEMLQMSEGCLHVLARGPTAVARLASCAATTNATNVKTSAGRVYQLSGKNNAAYDVFLVLYDAATNPPVPGTTAIREKRVCPAGQAFVYDIPGGVYANGIGYAFTQLVADADTTALAAGDITAFNLDYA